MIRGDAMIPHDAFPVERWRVRETALDLDLLRAAGSIFALANGHLGCAATSTAPRAAAAAFPDGVPRPPAAGRRAR